MNNIDFKGERNFKFCSLGLTLSGFQLIRWKEYGNYLLFHKSMFKAKFWFQYTGQSQCMPEKYPRGRDGSFGSDIRILNHACDMAQCSSEHGRAEKGDLSSPLTLSVSPVSFFPVPTYSAPLQC